MFDGRDYPKPLDESLFEIWLEKGRESKISYNFLLLIWDDLDAQYLPVYAEHRDTFSEYEKYGESKGREALVAVYGLFSEARIGV